MRLLSWIVTLGAAGLVVVAGVGFYLFQHFSADLPDYSHLAEYQPPTTTRVHAGDGRVLSEFAVQQRVFVPIETIPLRVRNAFISAEDQNFYSHPGIDFRSVARAALTNLSQLGQNRRPEGASTITQQVAKNFLLTNEVSLERKVREALLAFRIEQTLSKDQILELYLNEIYLGGGAYGVAAAALLYFNKSLDNLTLAEAAYLAALPKAPNNYHPTRRTEQAVIRRNWVLGRMREDGFITPEEARAAMEQPLETRSRTEAEVARADYFTEDVRREIMRQFGADALYEGGLSVRTSLVPELQRFADDALRNGVLTYDRRFGWRGPLENIEIDDEGWLIPLRRVERPEGAEGWDLAIVLDDEIAEEVPIGLSDGSRGRIPMEELRWARPQLEDRRVGNEPSHPSDVLALGDVILVERLDRQEENTEARDAESSESEAAEDGAAEGETAEDGTAEDDSGEDKTAEDAPAPRYALRQIPEVNGALVALDPHTGRVLAMSGGFSYELSEFNRASQANRQTGSSFKPFVYLAALENGFTPSSIILDAPFVINQGPGQGQWRPSNYSNRYYGPTPLRVGVELSRNLMTVRLAQNVGMDKVVDVAERFDLLDNPPPVLSLALGAGETTALRITSAYAMLVNGGKRITPTLIDRVQDRHGKTIYRHESRSCDGCNLEGDYDGSPPPVLTDTREQIVDSAAAYQIVSMLEGVVQRGTATSVRAVGKPLAGKTGTTNDYKDAWFVGFSPDLAVGVYIGFDQPAYLGPRQSGGAVAAPIFRDFMMAALEDEPATPFRVPDSVRLVRVVRDTGEPASQSGRGVIWEAFKEGTGPGDGPGLLDGAPLGSAAAAPPAIGGMDDSGSGAGGLY
nr:penicillin-binding protein 1A [Fodinicurvata sp. CAU 1616]